MRLAIVVAVACTVSFSFTQAQNAGSIIATEAPVDRVLFSADSRTVAGVMAEGVGLWDVASGDLRGTVGWDAGSAPGIAITPSLDRMAAVGDDGTARVWNLLNGDRPGRIDGVDTSPAGSILSADGALLAQNDDRGLRLRVWDTSSGRLRFSSDTGLGQTQALAFSSDGSRLAVATGDTDIRVWRTEDGRLERVIGDLHLVTNALEFTADGAFLVSAGVDRNIYVWDTRTWTRARQFEQRHPEPVWAMDLSADGRLLATAGGLDGVPNTPSHLILWNFESGSELGRIRLARTWGPSVAISPDGTLVAVANGENEIRLWPVAELVN